MTTHLTFQVMRLDTTSSGLFRGVENFNKGVNL